MFIHQTILKIESHELEAFKNPYLFPYLPLPIHISLHSNPFHLFRSQFITNYGRHRGSKLPLKNTSLVVNNQILLKSNPFFKNFRDLKIKHLSNCKCSSCCTAVIFIVNKRIQTQ